MNRFAAGALALALAAAAGSAAAQTPEYGDDYDYSSDGYGYAEGDEYADVADSEYADPAYAGADVDVDYSAPESDMARVLSVVPIVERNDVVARQECWSEPVGSYDRYDRGDRRHSGTSGGGLLLGAIIGGALGREVGRSDHRGHRRNHDRGTATVAGAIIGATIGATAERDSHYRSGYGSDRYGYDGYREVQHCRSIGGEPGEGRVTGYRVSYEYDGRRYETVTDYHPGSELAVHVEVSPQR